MLAHAVPVPLTAPGLDIVGTGGDRAHTVNISTMAALVAAAAGAPVVKHGNRAASSQTGTADVLERLGVPLSLPPEAVLACVDDAGIGFCFAAAFHPAMRHAAAPRRELGVPTVFNVLGPLANPAQPAAALIGCADARLAPVHGGGARARGTRALVVRGDDGLDELTPATTTSVWDVRPGRRGPCRPIDPQALGLAAPAEGALRGGTRTPTRPSCGGAGRGTRDRPAPSGMRSGSTPRRRWWPLTRRCRAGVRPVTASVQDRVAAALPRAPRSSTAVPPRGAGPVGRAGRGPA